MNLAKSPGDGTLLGRTSSEVFVLWIVVILHSLLFFIHFCSSFVVILHFQATLPCHRHSTLVTQARKGLHQLWTLPWLLSIAFAFHLPWALRFLVGIFYPQAFFTFRSFPNIFNSTCFYQGLPGSRQFFLEVVGLHADPQNTDPAHLFIWFTAIHDFDDQKNSFLNSTKYHHDLLVVKNLVFLLLTRFELFSLVQSHMLRLQKNTLNKACTAYNRFDNTKVIFEKAATRKCLMSNR